MKERLKIVGAVVAIFGIFVFGWLVWSWFIPWMAGTDEVSLKELKQEILQLRDEVDFLARQNDYLIYRVDEARSMLMWTRSDEPQTQENGE
jgi:hypothetical protein